MPGCKPKRHVIAAGIQYNNQAERLSFCRRNKKRRNSWESLRIDRNPNWGCLNRRDCYNTCFLPLIFWVSHCCSWTFAFRVLWPFTRVRPFIGCHSPVSRYSAIRLAFIFAEMETPIWVSGEWTAAQNTLGTVLLRCLQYLMFTVFNVYSI
jgi:hypothetical protein